MLEAAIKANFPDRKPSFQGTASLTSTKRTYGCPSIKLENKELPLAVVPITKTDVEKINTVKRYNDNLFLELIMI